MDGRSDRLAVSAASCSGPYDGDWAMQFSLLCLNATTGDTLYSYELPHCRDANHVQLIEQ